MTSADHVGSDPLDFDYLSSRGEPSALWHRKREYRPVNKKTGSYASRHRSLERDHAVPLETSPSKSMDSEFASMSKAGVPLLSVECLVGGGLMPASAIAHGARVKPKPDRDDCGWMLWSGEPDFEVSAAQAQKWAHESRR